MSVTVVCQKGEWATLLPLVFLSLFMGVFSSLFTPSLEKPVMKIIQDARAKSDSMGASIRVVPRPTAPPGQPGGHP